MTIELPGALEERLQDLALRQDRDVSAVVEEALRQYLEAASLTDVDSAEVAETQVALLDELSVPAWKGGRG